MSLLSSKRFVVKVADSSEETARTSRRLIVNADIVKATKLCTGDVIALSDCDNVKVGPDGVQYLSTVINISHDRRLPWGLYGRQRICRQIVGIFIAFLRLSLMRTYWWRVFPSHTSLPICLPYCPSYGQYSGVHLRFTGRRLFKVATTPSTFERHQRSRNDPFERNVSQYSSAVYFRQLA
jgi:hypothetical protein